MALSVLHQINVAIELCVTEKDDKAPLRVSDLKALSSLLSRMINFVADRPFDASINMSQLEDLNPDV